MIYENVPEKMFVYWFFDHTLNTATVWPNIDRDADYFANFNNSTVSSDFAINTAATTPQRAWVPTNYSALGQTSGNGYYSSASTVNGNIIGLKGAIQLGFGWAPDGPEWNSYYYGSGNVASDLSVWQASNGTWYINSHDPGFANMKMFELINPTIATVDGKFYLDADFKFGNQSLWGTNFYQLPSEQLDWTIGHLTIGAAPVPVPSAVWLFGSALLGLMGMNRKNPA